MTPATMALLTAARAAGHAANLEQADHLVGIVSGLVMVMMATVGAAFGWLVRRLACLGRQIDALGDQVIEARGDIRRVDTRLNDHLEVARDHSRR